MGESASSQPRRAGIARAMRDLLSFGACFALSVFLVGAALPARVEPMLLEKFARLAEEPERYDTVFFGSSITYRGYDPLAFDAEAAGLGLDVSSFNLGALGFAAADVRCALEHLVAFELPNLEYAIIHADRLIQPADLRIPLTGKAVAWHDPVTTMAALEMVWALDEPLPNRLLYAYRNVVALGYHELYVGRGSDWMHGALGLGPQPEKRRAWLGEAGRGHRVPRVEESAVLARQRRMFLEVQERYVQKIKRQARHPRGAGELEPWARRAFEEFAQTLEASGIAPVFVIAIRDEETPSLRDACAAGLLGPAIELDDPNAYPELYDPQNHFDRSHLNGPGAIVLSRLIARGFVELVRAGAVGDPADAVGAPPGAEEETR